MTFVGVLCQGKEEQWVKKKHKYDIIQSRGCTYYDQQLFLREPIDMYHLVVPTGFFNQANNFGSVCNVSTDYDELKDRPLYTLFSADRGNAIQIDSCIPTTTSSTHRIIHRHTVGNQTVDHVPYCLEILP